MIAVQRTWRLPAVSFSLFLATIAGASATPTLLVDADSGAVLYQEDATESWFPASLTKLMTVYVALHAVKDGKMSLDTPLVVSTRAARVAPSKMGFRPGTIVTLGNALKMLMVKSANDIAVTVAEGVSGSVDAFADDMNAAAKNLGMHESYFDNPNGLPDDRQVMSARDIATLARALYTEFPDERPLFAIGALQLGPQIIENHNGLLGRYPGADGMKTGFTCAAGFNLVATATQGSRHLIAVVLGAPTIRERNLKAAELLDAGFAGSLHGGGDLSSLPSDGIRPAPDWRQHVCSRRPRSEAQAEEAKAATIPTPGQPGPAGFLGALFSHVSVATSGTMVMLAQEHERPHFDPVPVFIGPAPGWKGPIPSAGTAVAAAAPKPAAPTAPASTAAYAPPEPAGDAAAAATAAAGPAKLSGATDLKATHTKVKRKLVIERPKPKAAKVVHAKLVKKPHPQVAGQSTKS